MQIKYRWDTTKVIYEAVEAKTLREALEQAAKVGATLDGASLDGASLRNASLDGASLDGA